MNKQAIQNTAIAYWCNDDECFIVASPLMDSIIGAGDSVEEARREFNDILSDTYEAYLEGRLGADRPGRPAKNRIAFNTDVKHETRAAVKEMAAQLACSQGEVVDYLLSFYRHRVDAESKAPARTVGCATQVSARASQGDKISKTMRGKSAALSVSETDSDPGSTYSVDAASSWLNTSEPSVGSLAHAVSDLQQRISILEKRVLKSPPA